MGFWKDECEYHPGEYLQRDKDAGRWFCTQDDCPGDEEDDEE